MIYLQKKSIAEIPPASGSVSDTLNVTDKITNAPSIRLVEEMIEDAAGESSGDIIEDGSGLPKDGVIAFDGVEEDIPEGYELTDDPHLTLKQEIYDAIYPIGRVIVDETGTDYSNYLGFTWERTLKGVSPIGINSEDTDFNNIGNTGGSKTKIISKTNLPNYTLYDTTHAHTQNAHSHNVPVHAYSNGSTSGNSCSDATSSSVSHYVTSEPAQPTINATRITVTSGGSDTPLDVMNPYKVVAFWKRVA